MNKDASKKRRTSVLATLYFEPMLSPVQLSRQLEDIHGLVVSADLVRSDLTWLHEMELVHFDGRVACCSARGKDVACGRALFPGEA